MQRMRRNRRKTRNDEIEETLNKQRRGEINEVINKSRNEKTLDKDGINVKLL